MKIQNFQQTAAQDLQRQQETLLAPITQKLHFTGKTVLPVTSQDKSQVKDYEIKVLVHKVNPDLLVWPQEWRRDLPGYQSDAIGHKAVKQADDLYRIMVYDGQECELLTASSPNQGTWDRQIIDLPFEWLRM